MNSNLPWGAESNPNAPWNQQESMHDEKLCKSCDSQQIRKMAMVESKITQEDEYDIYEKMYEEAEFCSMCKQIKKMSLEWKS
jgi:hypothetical protein